MKALLSLCLLAVVVTAVRNDAALSEGAMGAPEKTSPSLLEADSSADLTAQATAGIEAALGLNTESESEGEGAAADPEGKQQRNGFLKVLYDELKKLSDGSFAPLPSPSSSTSGSASVSALGADPVDPRVAALEKRLAMFERQRQKHANRAQDTAISGINERLVGLDQTLASLKRSAEQQQMLAQQLLRGAAPGESGAVNTAPDFSVLYAKASLPADFDARVQEILDTVRVEARKIYEKHCANTPRPGTGTPKSYPREKTPAIKGLKPAAKPKPLPGPAKAKAKPKHKKKKAHKYKKLPERKPSNPNADPVDAAPAQVHAEPVKLTKPVMKGHEPTPQHLRKLKAMLDLQRKLPITPAYHLPTNQKALQDVLGEDAVGNKWKQT